MTIDGSPVGKFPCETEHKLFGTSVSSGAHVIGFGPIETSATSTQPACTASLVVEYEPSCHIRFTPSESKPQLDWRAAGENPRCELVIDDVSLGERPCEGSLEGGQLEPGAHVATLLVSDGTTSVSCAADFDVQSKVECLVEVTPDSSVATSTFSVQLASSGTRCRLELDGHAMGAIGCGDEVEIFNPNLAEGLHFVTARVEDDLGGSASCSATFEVRPVPECTLKITPERGGVDTEFEASLESTASTCSLRVDSREIGSIACDGLEAFRGSRVGQGQHRATVTAHEGNGDESECSATFTVDGPTQCAVDVSPSAGVAGTEFVARVDTNGTACALKIDDAGPRSIACSGDVPLAAAGLEAGAHAVTVEVLEAPGGTASCSDGFRIYPPTTCALNVSPTSGSATATFVASASTNGSNCTIGVDGGTAVSVPCNGTKSFLGSALGGVGRHTLTLHVGAGPGGAATCSAEVEVTATTPTSCSLGVTPTSGSETATFVASASTNGSNCTIGVDGGTAVSAPCNGTKSFLGSALGGVGRHTVTFFVGTGPGGAATCSADVEVTATTPTSCSLGVTPTSGSETATFVASASTNGSNCTIGVDGGTAMSAPCNGTKSFLGSALGGVGRHTVTLFVGTGPGGATTCSADVEVTPLPSPTCALSVSPNVGLGDTTFSAAFSSNASSCSLMRNGTSIGPVSCNGSRDFLGSAVGVGVHTLVLHANSGSASTTCSTTFAVRVPTTCTVDVSPNTGNLRSQFMAQFDSNGSSCRYTLNGNDRGATACSGSVSFRGSLVGAGVHRVVLQVGDGPSGGNSCSTTFGVVP